MSGDYAGAGGGSRHRSSDNKRRRSNSGGDRGHNKRRIVDTFQKYATEYDPIAVASIDGTDTEPHDGAVVRALNSKYTPDSQLDGDPKCTIFVGRIHLKTDEDTLTEKFSRYGKIVRCRIVRHIITGISRTYGFIEFSERTAAERAVLDKNKTTVDGLEVLVDFEHGRTMKGWKPRRLGGGFGGRKESGQLRFGCKDRPFQRPFATATESGANMREVFRKQKHIRLGISHSVDTKTSSQKSASRRRL